VPSERQAIELSDGLRIAFDAIHPPAPPSPQPPPIPPSPPPERFLSPDTCSNLLADPNSLMRKMWGIEPRHQNRAGGEACWDRVRDNRDQRQLNLTYFLQTYEGTHCTSTNWYEGSPWAHGHFRKHEAPALLGFDGHIHRYCRNRCDKANVNILNLFSDRIEYNTCRNFEWQVCAAKGLLPNQDNGTINFATAPKDLDLHAYPPFGCCHGWTDRSCDLDTGFANDDIYYLEVCLFSQVCSNRDELFAINALDDFRCVFDDAGFNRLMGLLREGPADGKLGGVCDADLGPGVECMNEVYQQCGGNNFKGQRCCRPGSSCEGDQWYKQCRP